MFVIAAQICILYGSAGLYKVQGGLWENGTALHYVMNLDLFQPWPSLSHMVDRQQMLVAVVSYLTVLVQVAFPFVLFGRLKYVFVTILLGMHLGIAILLGLPLFSGAMIVADAVFLPDRFYRFLGRTCRRTFSRTAPHAKILMAGAVDRDLPVMCGADVAQPAQRQLGSLGGGGRDVGERAAVTHVQRGDLGPPFAGAGG
jgi:hypothetical protein